MWSLHRLKIFIFALWLIYLPFDASAASPSVAVFPLQEVAAGRQGSNLQLTGALALLLSEIGTEIVFPEAVISFMATSRIRVLGHLERRHILQARRDLGVSFVLLGTIFERNKYRVPSIGLKLSLVRTSDARTIWMYSSSVSAARERVPLAIGEAETSDDLQPLLLEEIKEQWPLQTILDEQLASSIILDTVRLTPNVVQPGGEVTCRVRFFESWDAGNVPKIFFKVGEQLYPAAPSAVEKTFEGTWLAAEENGRYSVSLIIDWPHYQRTETLLLGHYLVDGTLPMFELVLRGASEQDGRPLFYESLLIQTRKMTYEPVDRWKLSIFSDRSKQTVATLDGKGDLPESFFWDGLKGSNPEGLYRVTLEAWDAAENLAQVSSEVVLALRPAQVELDLKNEGNGVVVNLKEKGAIPLNYWRLEMWTKEGRIITQNEGQELPVKIEAVVPDDYSGDQISHIDGYLYYSDIMGRTTRKEIRDFLPKLEVEDDKVEEKPKGISESWVDDF